jgi:YD repeat-containing protein
VLSKSSSLSKVVIAIALSCSAQAAFAESKVEAITYQDDLQRWVLGQVAQVKANDIVASQVSYNSLSQPIEVKKFGLVAGTYTYNADGTMSSSKDGNNRAITYSSWKRGIPQTIAYADGKSQSATVNDQGWATAEVDQSGYRTEYGYDQLGRITLIKPPVEDSGAWNSTAQVFTKVAAAEYSLPAGHWRKTTSVGNARKITYYDAFWRPLLVQEYDTADLAGTQRFQRFAYDAEGRQTFVSYPSTSSAPNTGSWKTYDALGRMNSASQDSEGGTLVSLTEYLTGNKTRTTDPLGHQVTASFQAFDQPSYEAATVIDVAGGAKTTIPRDVFGKPASIGRTKSGS